MQRFFTFTPGSSANFLGNLAANSSTTQVCFAPTTTDFNFLCGGGGAPNSAGCTGNCTVNLREPTNQPLISGKLYRLKVQRFQPGSSTWSLGITMQ